MNYYPDREGLFAAIRALDFSDIVQRLGLTPDHGGRITCPNPDHADEHPSCKVYSDHAFCFSCGRWFDAVELWHAVRGTGSRYKAAQEIAQEYGIQYDSKPAKRRQKSQKAIRAATITDAKNWLVFAFRSLTEERNRLETSLGEYSETTSPKIVQEAVKRLTFCRNWLDDLQAPSDADLMEIYTNREALGLPEPDPAPELIEQENRDEFKPANEFEKQEIDWLWKGRIPRGYISFLMAPGGSGKSFISASIAAAVSSGRALPDGDEATPETVLYLSAEDSGSILKERLESCNADLTKIHIQDIDAENPLTFPDTFRDTEVISRLTKTLEKYKPALVICDVWHAFCSPEIDLNRQNCVRAVLRTVGHLARAHNAAFLLLAHTSKRRQETNLNDALLGSSDSVNAARSVLMVVTDSETQERALLHTKCNVAGLAPSLEFRIDNGQLTFGGLSPITKAICEEAARSHSTPWEIAKMREEKPMNDKRLLSCLAELAEIGKTVALTYDQVIEHGGNDIFNGLQPKRALDSLRRSDLLSRGLRIETGKRVNTPNGVKRGFWLSCNTTSDEIAGAMPK
jgi:hypothetical protein